MFIGFLEGWEKSYCCRVGLVLRLLFVWMEIKVRLLKCMVFFSRKKFRQVFAVNLVEMR